MQNLTYSFLIIAGRSWLLKHFMYFLRDWVGVGVEGWGGGRECRAERGQCGPGKAGQLQLVDYILPPPISCCRAEKKKGEARGAFKHGSGQRGILDGGGVVPVAGRSFMDEEAEKIRPIAPSGFGCAF